MSIYFIHICKYRPILHDMQSNLDHFCLFNDSFHVQHYAKTLVLQLCRSETETPTGSKILTVASGESEQFCGFAVLQSSSFYSLLFTLITHHSQLLIPHSSRLTPHASRLMTLRFTLTTMTPGSFFNPE